MLVGAQIVNPQVLCPGRFAGGLPVEEQHVGLDALGIEDSRGQAQQGVHVTTCQQTLADGFPSTPFEQHVVRHHDGRPAMLLENLFTCCRKFNCLLDVVAQKSSRS